AEGATLDGFETWVLVQNPNPTTTQANITFMTDSGQVAGPTLDLKANSRESVNVANYVQTYNVSTKVTATQPVIAERSMYYSRPVQPEPQPEPEPEPQPEPQPTTYDFSGSGNKATQLFTLQEGITTFDLTHDGESNFIVWLKDQNGENVDLAANAIGSFAGGKLVSVDNTAGYILDIKADGNWAIHVEQPRPTTAPGVPQTFTGNSDDYSPFFTLSSGAARFDMTYQGDSNFIIWLYNSDGEMLELLENEIGSRSDSTVISVDQGIHILDITGEGSWSITVTQ
ncbi:MAG: hypothetical protein L6427_01275, partial [Actinomycetia bacterium]|nr:hypothetical protein [Actinomycetes bacterium]